MISQEKTTNRPEGAQKPAAPSISLPKGGGAIRGMGEKFAANPVTGTGSMSVPIATSPGRSGFGPQLALSYDSGAGNGPFGLGWSLSLPSITRKTDKGLPQYRDAEEFDVFILSGAEDLVPVLNADGTRWSETRTIDGIAYRIHRYRPRIEGLFARIERWTNTADAIDVFWRSISKDNITTLYGRTANSRIADPDDPTRIFSWLICETRDDKGNAVVYEYKPEDSVGVDPTQAHERNRSEETRSAQRYLKRIRYGNRTPLLDSQGRRPTFLSWSQIQNAGWLFEVVFDYGDHDEEAPTPAESLPWSRRPDPFSTYRAGFEVRTYRLCQRVLMFHHIPDLPTGESGYNGLVRSTDFTYAYEEDPTSARNPVYSFLTSVTQSGYRRDGAGYRKRSLPPLEFSYSQPEVQEVVEEVDAESLENLPAGLDGGSYQWTDLHGEGVPGILTEQGSGWFYKRNLSPLPVEENGKETVRARFAPVERVPVKPNLALAGGAQFMDLAGDGQPDLVVTDGPMAGLYEHDEHESWQPFRPFAAPLNRNLRDPNLRFVDLDGDGHADVLISEDDAFVWHASLAEEGFGPAWRVAQALDEEKGPRLVFADGTQSIYLADMSGDGLTDLVRIRNGEVCYWPNLGYGRFGARVTMDHAPWFDAPDQFDQKRIRLADIDGSGATDIIYLHRDGVRLYFNQSGNSWSAPRELPIFPQVDDLVHIQALDLLGNGTACLVWSSPLPGDARRPMRYVQLMAEKPHLLIKTVNNLGAETRVHYAPSTRFYLADKQAGRPWITRLPFPVHVVERVETYDHLSRNRFVTRYAYHHGYFDGEEREFRGFGMVEQWDTEELAALTESGTFPTGENWDAASHVPPVLTRTWFHTGVYLGRNHVSDFFAGLLDAQDKGEYYREPGLTDTQARALLLPDTVLPEGLTVEEEREACRALKGSMLRQEVYALDGTEKAGHPYTVAEQNFAIRVLQRRGTNRHAVFFTHPREVLTYHYERNPADPRIQHALTLEVDEFGNVLKEAAVGYGRRQQDTSLPTDADRSRQTQTLITYTENQVTNAIDTADDYRTPLPAETRTYESTGFKPENNAARFSFDEWTRNGFALAASATEIPYEQTANNVSGQKRLIEQVRTLYRRNELNGLLPLGRLEPLALPGESYKLAFTPGLLSQVFRRNGQALLPNPAAVLGGQGADQGGYVDLDGDGRWWIPSGRIFYSLNSGDTSVQELAEARAHFFLPRRFRDPFGHDVTVTYDAYDLLLLETEDALGNRVTVGERNASGTITRRANDYRVLQPWLVSDPNRNRSAVAFDTLGMVVGTAVMGKPEENLGDSLAGFEADLDETAILAHLQNPLANPHALLQKATTRLVYDLFAYFRTKNAPNPQPAVVYTLARETHDSDLNGQQTKIQHSFSYSDGFGRETQKKIQAEPGPVPQRDANGKIIVGADGQPVMTPNDVSPRWVGSGWTVFNNKGKPVRQYEPFFTDTHRFEFDVRIGVSPVLFYDPVERVVATLHPNHTWEKVVFDPWQQAAWDVNDTVLLNPAEDPDAGGFFRRLPRGEYLPTWHALRTDPAHAAAFAARYPEAVLRAAETSAARKSQVHAATPTAAHFDSLGRTFLTLAHNRLTRNGSTLEEQIPTRVELDIEGNQRAVRDAIVQDGDLLGRIVMRYDYDLLGNRIHQASQEAGERWMLNDATGKPIRAWDSRGFARRLTYDQLRRPTGLYVTENGSERLAERSEYGEGQGETHNHRGRLYRQFDQAGVVTHVAYDFKGNLLESRRQLLRDYKTLPDWSGSPALETETFTGRTAFDALNRPVELRPPDGSVLRPSYNEANLLERMEANLRGAATATVFVADLDYNAKGQRERIAYGNGAVTTYTYDLLTFRLTRLTTTRNGGEVLQDLRYTYDPAGNITHIRDEAQQTVYFNNAVVEPHAEYTYDALYRLIEATGREHIGQSNLPVPTSWDDAPRVRLAHPHDGQALRRYLERYEYDAVGNFLQMVHQALNGSWTREYAYEEPSLLESAKTGNRLSRTNIGSNTEPYSHDAHGNMTAMPHLPLMRWDFKDQLQATSQQVVSNGGTPEITYYVYDASGQRVRKVTERQAPAGQTPTRLKERIYLGGFEIYRKYAGDGETVTLARETLHIMDDQQRIALVETRTQGSDPAPAQLIRYQLGNHLGSASLELDGGGQIISYEEYYPYGSTSYQAVRSQTETPKRYRYTSMERDEENGLDYHSARYYVPWLGWWTACDPAGIKSGVNLYSYVLNAPTQKVDPSGLDGWDRFWGGVKMVGGALETAAGVALVAAGVATSEIGVGVLLIGAGTVVTAHGADTTVSGARTMWNGAPVDTFTSQGLQAAGMSRTEANLLDNAIGAAGSFGASFAPRAVAVAGTTARTAVLVHRTTPQAAEAINRTQTLGLGGTIYAGPSTLAEASAVGVTLRTGLLPSQAAAVVRIPETAAGAFRVPVVVGPLTGWQRVSGTVYSAGAGSINLATGVFTRTGPATNQNVIYGLDATVNMTLRSVPEGREIVREIVSGGTTSSPAPVSSVTGMPAAVSISATSSASRSARSHRTSNGPRSSACGTCSYTAISTSIQTSSGKLPVATPLP
ncbi:MAG: FG-GAP-like repeat-containing protein [Roseiflexus sp.]|nr:SpvB/TcaC N-terminal domain-containing protein [Roseiflexus sp.]MCL6542211.1 FG-GAP-like repeat-containing protein [Roseiflexus sp.]